MRRGSYQTLASYKLLYLLKVHCLVLRCTT